jgi:NosR/NirI family nitrous oxide reductase transcriptional regulator
MTRLKKIAAQFSSKVGVRDLPRLDTQHQSNVPGLYIVGDLADAPIIKLALKQGFDVAQGVASHLSSVAHSIDHDVLIIGAGPAGVGAAIALRDAGVSYMIYERDRPFSTIDHFPLGKMIYMEPKGIHNPTDFDVQDSTKEDLVEQWAASLDSEDLNIQSSVEVFSATRAPHGFDVEVRSPDGTPTIVRTQKIILAAGKRGQFRTLGIPGEDQPHVHYSLKDPNAHAGQAIVVIGGGDSAIETAVSLADGGASVTLSYRGDSFHRCKQRNQEKINDRSERGLVDVHRNSRVTEVRANTVVLQLGDDPPTEINADQVYPMLGTEMPLAFLKRLGVRMRGDLRAVDAAWIGSFMTFVYGFYCLKSKQQLYPFGADDPLGFLHDAMKMDLGFREVDASFWGTCAYALLVLVFGLRAYFRYPSPVQQRRYLSLISYQWVFLFGVPELLAPMLIDRPWKVYAVAVPWPLSIWSMIDAPSWADGDTLSAVLWIAAGAATTFVAIPLYVRRNGERFCSYLCGCGGLAETLGDTWRHLAPRGRTAKNAEVFGRLIFLLAIPVTLLILNDAWAFFAKDALYSTKVFAQHWYGLMVDFWLASIVGVALYPYLGNRVWCRFFCPLRAYMEEIARRISRIAIVADDKCIGCGECTRYCQMGIPVQDFAQKQVTLDNTNSACIQCGICIEVCPLEVLSISDKGREVVLNLPKLMPPMASWE